MPNTIKAMNADEIALIAGGVTEGPDGKSCTEHGLPKLLGSPELWGGPIKVDLFA